MLTLVSGYVRNEASRTAGLVAAARAAGTTLVEATAARGLLLGRLTADGRFPAVSEVIGSGALDEPGRPEQDFTFGLTLALDGVEAYVAKGGHDART